MSRRWFCERSDCPQSIFTERLPGLARRTERVTDLFHCVAYAVGGEGGARLLREFGLAISPDTSW